MAETFSAADLADCAEGVVRQRHNTKGAEGDLFSGMPEVRLMTSENLHPLHRVDQARLLGFGCAAGRVVVERGLNVRDPLLGAAILSETFLPDTLYERSFFRGQRRVTAVIASHGHLPVCSGRSDVSSARTFPDEVLDRVPRSRKQLTQLRAPD